MIYDSHHRFSFRFSGSDRISLSSVTLTSKKEGLVYGVLKVMNVFQPEIFRTINFGQIFISIFFSIFYLQINLGHTVCLIINSYSD